MVATCEARLSQLIEVIRNSNTPHAQAATVNSNSPEPRVNCTVPKWEPVPTEPFRTPGVPGRNAPFAHTWSRLDPSKTMAFVASATGTYAVAIAPAGIVAESEYATVSHGPVRAMASILATLGHGSPKTVSDAKTEHDDWPTQAWVTDAIVLFALQELYCRLGHVPVGVPKKANVTPVNKLRMIGG